MDDQGMSDEEMERLEADALDEAWEEMKAEADAENAAGAAEETEAAAAEAEAEAQDI